MNIMSYVYDFLTWFVSAFIWGLLGVYFGPGIIMLFLGLFVGLSGCSFSFCERAFGFDVPWFWAGISVSILSFLLAASVLADSFQSTTGHLFVMLFIAVPSFLTAIFIKKYKNWFFKE
jgi:hypothetical protein